MSLDQLEVRGEHLAIGIPDFQPAVIKHGGPGDILEEDALRIRRNGRR